MNELKSKISRKLSPRKGQRGGFTLLEVVISMGIMVLLAASIYAVMQASIGASESAMEQQLELRRLDGFLRVTREAFLNLPATGSVSYEVGTGSRGEAEQRLVLGKASGLFGLSSLGGGSLVLAARARADGTRTITLLRVPGNLGDRKRDQALAAPGIPLLPRVRKPQWFFLQNGTWSEECPGGSPRPLAVKLIMEIDAIPEPVETVFYLPPVLASGSTGAPGGASITVGTPSPLPSVTPAQSPSR